jgi:hypothetical protein
MRIPPDKGDFCILILVYNLCMDEEVKIPNNLEIDQALKEFNAKSAESYKAIKFYNETDTPKMVQLVMKYSGVKEQKQAEYILLGFVVLAIGISLFLFFRGIGGGGAKPLTNNQIEQIIKNQQGVQVP